MLVDKNKEPAGEYAAGISRETFGMLKHLCKKDNYHWAIALGKDYAIIAFAIYLSLGISYWFYPVSLFLIGTTQRAWRMCCTSRRTRCWPRTALSIGSPARFSQAT